MSNGEDLHDHFGLGAMTTARLKYFAEIPKSDLEQFQDDVLTWYRAHGRDLPWRHTRNPYAILVSEIMLHQTQVRTVLPVYQAFMETFPTVEALANADLDAVKAITDPLGYKVRGRWLHQIAVTVVNEWSGQFPRTVEELCQLPGVGRYTAGAIMSFAYEEKAPILDTNVNRLLGRYYGIDYRDSHAEVRHQLWALAEASIPDDAVHAFNQALMDLGAQVCTSRKPTCLICPLYRGCVTGGLGMGHASKAAEESVQYHRRRPLKAEASADE